MASSFDFDEDDYFADTRMSFGDHLEVLRRHLWRALYGLGFCMLIGFIFDMIGYAVGSPYIGIGKPLMDVIQNPVRKAMVEFYDRRQKRLEEAADKAPESEDAKLLAPFQARIVFAREELERLGLKQEQPADTVELNVRLEPKAIYNAMQAIEQKIRPRELTTLSAQEGFVIYFKVSLISGFVIASPWVFWQVWSFIAAGLYPNEKRYVHLYLPISVALFLAGVLLCQFLVMPKAVGALLWFNEFLGITPDLRLSEWLSLAIMMPVVFGASFQTPLVMLFLVRIGVMDADSFRRKRKIAWFAMAIFAAIITPTPDAVTMMYLWLPMGILFELGIWLCKFSPNQSTLDELEVPQSNELIEV